MKTKFTTLNVVTTAMLSAVAVILASVFHMLGGQSISTLFSPMHFPVLLCGILCGPWLGMICGFCTPIVSFAAAGRPPFPVQLVPMVLELTVYGFVTGLMRWVFLKNSKTDRFASVLALVIAMIAGRLINAFAGAFFLMNDQGGYFVALAAKLASNFGSTWAGIILQLVLIPAILYALKRGGILIKYLPDTPRYQRSAPQNGDADASNGAE